MFNGNDPELLSAYLDDALSPEERAALEARLQTDAGLRRELARLRATVELIGTLPTLRAPRNFTVTPRMVRRPSLLTSAAFSAMSAAAALVLLVIGAALFSFRPPAASPALDQVAFAPTILPATTTELRDTTSSAIPQAANVAQATALKSETVPGSDGLFLTLPTGTLAATPLPPMLYAAQATNEAFGSLEMQADTAAVQETGDDQQRNTAVQPAPVAASGAAAEAPLPEPTLLPSETPSLTPSATPTPPPSATLLPTYTPTLAPTPAPLVSPTQNTNTVGIGLIVAALLLFGVALVTTLLRRRA